MAKKKSAYSDILFWNKEKDVDNSSEIEDNNSIEGEILENTMKTEAKKFEPKVNAYVPYYDEAKKTYEMFTVYIDPDTGLAELKRERLPYDTYNRCVLDMQKRYAADYSTYLRKLRGRK